MEKLIDIRGNKSRTNYAGQVFGRWTVLRFSHRNRSDDNYWICHCECGTERAVPIARLQSGKSKSCGCLQKEVYGKHCITHNLSKSSFYRTWNGMTQRCTNSNAPPYKYYGARGIKVCDRWLKFSNFKDDMYEEYLIHSKEHGEKNTTIDRIENSGNYCPENCRWATREVQGNNRSTNHLLTYKGETMNILQWANKLNLNPSTLRHRISRYGWSVHRALTERPKPRKRKITH